MNKVSFPIRLKYETYADAGDYYERRNSYDPRIPSEGLDRLEAAFTRLLNFLVQTHGVTRKQLAYIVSGYEEDLIDGG